MEEPLRYDALTNTLLKNKVFIKALELRSVCAARYCMFETECVWRHLNGASMIDKRTWQPEDYNNVPWKSLSVSKFLCQIRIPHFSVKREEKKLDMSVRLGRA